MLSPKLISAPGFTRAKRGAIVSLAAVACAVAGGCVAGTGAAGTANQGAAAVVGVKAVGTFETTLDSKLIVLDYSAGTVSIALQHKISTDAKPTCVPDVHIIATIPTQINSVPPSTVGACKLDLTFKAGFAGQGLVLDKARFSARTLDPATNTAVDCPGWVTEPVKGEVVYENAGGDDVTLALGGIGQPYAAQASAVVPGLFLTPSGPVTFKFKGRQFNADLSKLSFKGDATSTGNATIECAKTFHEFPSWTMPDIQKVEKESGGGSTYGLDTFKGKRIVLLMGAGWCASCLAEAESMEKVNQELIKAGRKDYALLAIAEPSNIPGVLADKSTFPTFKGAWDLHTAVLSNGKKVKGNKGDGYAYDYDGRLMGYFEGAGTIYTSVFESWVLQMLNAPKDGKTNVICTTGGKDGCKQVD